MFGILVWCFLLLSSSTLFANGIGYEAFLYWGVFYSAIIFTIGFALEFMCMYILARVSSKNPLKDAFTCTLIMNLISTFLGVIVRAPFVILFFYFFFALRESILPAIGIFFIYVIINTITEVWIPLYYYFYPANSRAKIWLWTFIANF